MADRLKNLINNTLNKAFGYKLTKTDLSESQYRPILIKFINEHHEDIKGEVLDVGAGTWTWVKDTFGDKTHITSFDQTKHAGVDVEGDIHKLTEYLPTNKFDVVFCFEVIEHVKNPFTAITEIEKELKSGGLFVASTPFRHILHGEEYGDYWRITRQGWAELLSGFTDVRIVPVGDELMPHHYMISAKKK